MNSENFVKSYENCRLCPRKCSVNRRNGETGFCGVSANLTLARAALHYWEEPCLSGENGSGAVFFSGCNLRCIYCQNHDIAIAKIGQSVDDGRLTEIFFELKEAGANNINLVTAAPYLPHVIFSIKKAKDNGLDLPIIYNSSGYEDLESLKALEGLIDIYLPDFKYIDSKTAKEYSAAADYPEVAKAAIEEMYRQQPVCEFDEKGLMKKGLIIRHLLLPNELYASRRIIKYLFGKYENNVYYSLMSQYTPLSIVKDHPVLRKKIEKSSYDSLVDYAIKIGVNTGFTQDGEVASESFIPHFDYKGVQKY